MAITGTKNVSLAVSAKEVLNGALPVQKMADPNMLAELKHYRSRMPMAQDARKPMFLLKPADGAIGAHAQAVQDCFREFRKLVEMIGEQCGL